MNDWYPRCCPQCGTRFEDAHALMAHHISSGHEPPPFCAACQCMVDSGGDSPDGCRCLDNATLQNPHAHHFVRA